MGRPKALCKALTYSGGIPKATRMSKTLPLLRAGYTLRKKTPLLPWYSAQAEAKVELSAAWLDVEGVP